MLINGGPRALVWGILIVVAGALAQAASLAEMTSAQPIAGARYVCHSCQCDIPDHWNLQRSDWIRQSCYSHGIRLTRRLHRSDLGQHSICFRADLGVEVQS